MINSLYINNFALIQSQKIEFFDGYSVFTGETGAGKSILFEALDFLLGKRGDVKSIKEGSEKAIIEGEFDWKSEALKNLLSENQIDVIFPLIIRREISSNGRSRVFVNDTPAKVGLVKKIASLFLNLHTQHEILDLLSPKSQLKYLDEFAGLQNNLKNFSNKFNQLKAQQNLLVELKTKESEAKRDKDYFSFLVSELDDANTSNGEEQILEEELEIQENAEEIKTAFYNIHQLVYAETTGVYDLIYGAINTLGKAVKVPALENLTDRLRSVLVEIEDIGNEAEQKGEELVFDEAQKEKLKDRLDLLNNLLAKHHVKSSEELSAIKANLNEKLLSIGSLETEIKETEASIKNLNATLIDLSKAISTERKKQAKIFKSEVLRTAQSLGMPSATFEIEFTEKELSVNGIDDVNFLFSANKGVSPKPIQKVASGGELSRIMLSLKSALSDKVALQTQVFDEIDSGVSGEIAHKFGETFKHLGDKMQVIAITHLPQVAALAKYHYHVSKKEENGVAVSEIKLLSADERIFETAKLISSTKITDASLENAKQLLSN